MIRVGLMNGGLGKLTDAISPTVQAILSKLDISCDLFEERGSYFRKTQKSFESWVREHNTPDNTLVTVGKSTGAWNIMHGINRLNDGPGICYAYVHAVFIDMNYMNINIFRKLNRNDQTFVITNPHVKVHNFFQVGKIGGMLCTSHSGVNHEIKAVNGEAVTHFNIVNAPELLNTLEAALKAAHSFDSKTGFNGPLSARKG